MDIKNREDQQNIKAMKRDVKQNETVIINIMKRGVKQKENVLMLIVKQFETPYL